jgi:hypothetical protein
MTTGCVQIRVVMQQEAGNRFSSTPTTAWHVEVQVGFNAAGHLDSGAGTFTDGNVLRWDDTHKPQ